MSIVVALLAGAALTTGILLAIIGTREPPPARLAPPTRPAKRGARRGSHAGAGASTWWGSMSRPRRRLLLASVGVGILTALLTGWIIAIPLIPAATYGIPLLLAQSPSETAIARLEALEEWVRALSGVLTVGVSLEQAIAAALRSTPDAIRPEVDRLVSRLHARWRTEDALRGLADDLNDAVGDTVAAFLISGARRRGPGLAKVLEDLAESLSVEVAARRAIESDRSKPRWNARVITAITIGMIAVLFLTGDYIAPYREPGGQLILGFFLSIYLAALAWMRRIALEAPTPRFLIPTPAAQPDEDIA